MISGGWDEVVSMVVLGEVHVVVDEMFSAVSEETGLWKEVHVESEVTGSGKVVLGVGAATRRIVIPLSGVAICNCLCITCAITVGDKKRFRLVAVLLRKYAPYRLRSTFEVRTFWERNGYKNGSATVIIRLQSGRQIESQ